MPNAKHRQLFVWVAAIITIGVVAGAADVTTAQQTKPNILLIMSDDVGITNISAYSRGLVGYGASRFFLAINSNNEHSKQLSSRSLRLATRSKLCSAFQKSSLTN